MKNMVLITILSILLLPSVLAISENLNLNVDMPKEVSIGEDFTINLTVNVDNTNISGFECLIKVPGEGIKIMNISENEKIKKDAGQFYKLKKDNSSLFVSFATFGEPINSDFHLITIKAKALKSGDMPISFEPKASDENGKGISINKEIINLKIINNESSENINNNIGDKKNTNNNFLTSLINGIISFLGSIFGG